MVRGLLSSRTRSVWIWGMNPLAGEVLADTLPWGRLPFCFVDSFVFLFYLFILLFAVQQLLLNECARSVVLAHSEH